MAKFRINHSFWLYFCWFLERLHFFWKADFWLTSLFKGKLLIQCFFAFSINDWILWYFIVSGGYYWTQSFRNNISIMKHSLNFSKKLLIFCQIWLLLNGLFDHWLFFQNRFPISKFLMNLRNLLIFGMFHFSGRLIWSLLFSRLFPWLKIHLYM
jgi:hypothetical protein